MRGLPAILNLQGRRCVIIGGGSVAVRRAAALLDAGAAVSVIAPRVDAELAAMPVSIINRPYQRGDLDGAALVVIATDDSALNAAVAADARAAGALVNRADDPAAADLAIPAHHRCGPVTIAVDTSGISASAAAAIGRELCESLDPHWPILLETVSPYRRPIQQRFGDDPARRADKLTRLTGPQAMATLKQHGPEALQRYCQQLLDAD